ncbi:MAG: NfeD family protein [Eubacteriales bacterium]|nr:NfeD family protein [Eubacteriales bacterium]
MEDLTLHSWMLWLIVLIAFLIAEAVTQGLTTIWFAVGALAAMLTSFVQPHPILGLIVFIVVSAICLGLTRPLANRWTQKQSVATNADRLIGSTQVASERIDREGGLLQIGDIAWRVKLCPPSEKEQNDRSDARHTSTAVAAIEAGEEVVIDRIEGNLLWIRRK